MRALSHGVPLEFKTEFSQKILALKLRALLSRTCGIDTPDKSMRAKASCVRSVTMARTLGGIQPSISTASSSSKVAADKIAPAKPSAAISTQACNTGSDTCQ